jgi:hypothetical protein
MKKFFLLALSSLVLTFLFVLGFQYFMHIKSQKGALQVTSSPQSKVYIDDKYVGTTPLCKCEAADMLAVGDYTIKLIPTKGGFSEFQEKITISEAVLTVVDRKFAKDSLSEGSVISLTPLTDKTKTELLVASLPEGATVLLDNIDIGKSPLSFKDPTESDHKLTIKKTGYKEKTIRIRTPLGYKLTVAAYLSTIDDLSSLSEKQASESAAAALSPTPTFSKNTILILDTPTGFLRVRESINGAEIGRVTPGETYALLDEQSGWVQIQLKDGSKGWISNEYVQKQGESD